MKELIGKTRKSEPYLPGKCLINEHEVSGKEEIADEFNFFLQILAQSWPKKHQMRHGHLKVILKSRHNHANRLSYK